MKLRLFALSVIALLLAAAPSFSATCGPTDSTTCTVTVSPDDTTAVFDFSQGFNGRLVVQFETVLTTFDLIVKVNHTIYNFDTTHEFPPGTVCVPYAGNGPQCTQYDFSGTALTGGFMGVPVKNKDYKGLITLTLSYDNAGTIHNPAFAHAPGDITIFTEDILTSYFDTVGDPTMGGRTPGLSSVVAADEPFTETGDTFCSLTLTPTNDPDNKPEIEVNLKIVSGSNCSAPGLRDKTARLSVALSTFDSTINEEIITFPAIRNVEGNKFHWDSRNGLNEYDISLDGLTPGQQYTITVFSSKISPQVTTFTVPN